MSPVPSLVLFISYLLFVSPVWAANLSKKELQTIQCALRSCIQRETQVQPVLQACEKLEKEFTEYKSVSRKHQKTQSNEVALLRRLVASLRKTVAELKAKALTLANRPPKVIVRKETPSWVIPVIVTVGIVALAGGICIGYAIYGAVQNGKVVSPLTAQRSFSVTFR